MCVLPCPMGYVFIVPDCFVRMTAIELEVQAGGLFTSFSASDSSQM